MVLVVELVIGNVVRRVLHIIREEMDQQEETAELTMDNASPARVGGLSRALNR